MSLVAEEKVINKLNRRLLPILLISFFVSILDRTNISIASLQMNEDLALTAQMFGFGSGIFFISYFIFEVPSNYILERVGARRWIARIMLTWGIITMATMFVTGPISFYVLRFLLGAAEAGFYPGVIYYISTFYPARHRTKANAIFQIGSPIAVALGSPISGLILELDGLWGLRGWQLVFVLEGIPAVILGVIIWFYLTDSPSKAKWLKPEEIKWLNNELAKEATVKEHVSFFKLIKIPQLILQSFVYLSIVVGLYGVTIWLPQIVSQMSGASNLATSFLSAIPSILAIFGIVILASYAQKVKKQKKYAIISSVIGAIALVLSAFTGNPWIALVLLAVAATGIQAAIPLFWTLPSSMFFGATAAAAIAVINSIGNLGGFVGPYVVGYISDATGNLQYGLIFLGIVLFLGAIGLYYMKDNTKKLDDEDESKLDKVTS
ncbi:MFS transporter [Oceanobacillus sp. AG]|uniref:MFS transporter n=1 Tax=Oceanobacillus sp. AG TaxID=2681969 RepID=UPI0012EBA15D|nr:MFS transporter [Oceanobacillus sp. AG]